MADKQIMNRGWHRGAFSLPKSSNGMPLWPERLADAYRIFDFEWLVDMAGRSRGMRFENRPFVQRESGMPGLGGTYEHCIMAFDPADASTVVERQLALGATNGPAPMEPEGFNVTVHSGAFENESLHWIELYNPFSLRREHMSTSEFVTFVSSLVAAGLELIAGESPNRFAPGFTNLTYGGSVPAQPAARRAELISSALLLASLFCNVRLPFSELLRLRFDLGSYAAAYALLSQLPQDGSATEVPLAKLLLLYGEQD